VLGVVSGDSRTVFTNSPGRVRRTGARQRDRSGSDCARQRDLIAPKRRDLRQESGGSTRFAANFEWK
jgi:hypothetical protein